MYCVEQGYSIILLRGQKFENGDHCGPESWSPTYNDKWYNTIEYIFMNKTVS